MEKLCPVCNKTPLMGRQKICSSKCRSKQHRNKTKRQSSESSQQQSTPRHRKESAVHHGGRKTTVRSGPEVAERRWEVLLHEATAKIVAAIREHGIPAAPQTDTACRIDIKEQVTAQAPPGAIGYRLVLPPRPGSDTPKFSPKRQRGRAAAWYSLTPFEYPDDLRLCDGSWYRIVWIDAQGERLRMKPGDSVPGLCYWVGDPSQATLLRTPTHTDLDQSAVPAPGILIPVEGMEDTPLPCTTVAEDATASQSEQHASQNPEATPQNPEATSQNNNPSSEEHQIPNEASAVAGTVSLEEVAASGTMDFAEQDAASAGLDMLEDEISELLLRHQIAGPLGRSLLVTLPPEDLPTTPPPESWSQLLASFPPPTKEECVLQVVFVAQPQLMIQADYEQRTEHALSLGLPLPSPPSTTLSKEERDQVQALLRRQQLPPAFWVRCRAIIEYVRHHGADVLGHLPIPMNPLSRTTMELVEQSIRNPAKRKYMHYIAEQFEARLDAKRLPLEPKVQLRPKECRFLFRHMQDLRTVMYYKKLSQQSPPSQ